MIAIFFGGRSCEHDISIITGMQAMLACFERCCPVYIDENGLWWSGTGFDSFDAIKKKVFKGKLVHIRPSEPYLYCKNKKICRITTALLCNHGTLGEDGSLQGLLEMSNIPYTGSDVIASAIGMNKLASKLVFKSAGLDVLPYIAVHKKSFDTELTSVLKRVKSELGMPVIVKPCNLGSSIGISVARTQTEFCTAMRVAFEWDNTVIVEKALTDFVEVSCAVIGDCSGMGCYGSNRVDDGVNVDNLIVSETEQPIGWKEFLTFKDKYSNGGKESRKIQPASVPVEINDKIKQMAKVAFSAVGCSGVARVDFLVKGDNVYINEINTIPGSLASGLFEREMPLPRLIDKLIEIARVRNDRRNKLKRTYTPIEPVTFGK